jgi:hypothetical protein
VDATGTIFLKAGSVLDGGIAANLQGGAVNALKFDFRPISGSTLFNGVNMGSFRPTGPFSDETQQNNFSEATSQNDAKQNEQQKYTSTLNIYGDSVFAPYTGLSGSFGAGEGDGLVSGGDEGTGDDSFSPGGGTPGDGGTGDEAGISNSFGPGGEAPEGGAGTEDKERKEGK